MTLPVFARRTAVLALAVLLVLGMAPGARAQVRVGSVFSTANAQWQSHLRFYNAGTGPGQAVIQLLDFVTGVSLGQWISPSIPAGAEKQYDIRTVESALGGRKPPAYYTLSIQAGFPGYFQHVLWRSADGTLTNLSTCSEGVTAAGAVLIGVHSSLLNSGYPSMVVVNNTGAQGGAAVLGVYDARDATKIGTYTTTPIAAGAAQVITVSQIETAIGRAPGTDMYHYVIKAENPPEAPFTGFLEHLVDNRQTGVTTDMTNECALGGAPVAPSAMPIRVGAAFSTAQASFRSYLRIFNTGPASDNVRITLRNQATGQSYGTWITPSIPSGAERQFGIDMVEEALKLEGAAKPQYYTIAVESTMQGYFQHVLWRVADGTLTNLSTCDAGVAADKLTLTGVHSSLLGGAYPSGVVITNEGASTSVQLGVYDARDGTRRGGYVTDSIPSGGQFMISAAALEVAINRLPSDSAMYHYVIKAETLFNGHLQHLVNNDHAKVVTDMTIACAMNR